MSAPLAPLRTRVPAIGVALGAVVRLVLACQSVVARLLVRLLVQALAPSVLLVRTTIVVDRAVGDPPGLSGAPV